jgi:hypothetical protein
VKNLWSALVALSYADRRAFVNTVRTLPAHSGRLIAWTFYGLFIAGFALVKILPSRPHAAPSPIAVAIGDLCVSGFALAFGIVLATGTSRWLGVFSSRAEAMLVMRADAPPLLVAGYLQVRAIAAALVRGATRFAYLILIAVPSGTTPRILLAQVFFFCASGAAVASVALPRALARGFGRIAAIAAGVTLIAVAAYPLVLDLAVAAHVGGSAALLRAPAFHPSTILDAVSAGELRAMAIPLTVAAAATLAFVVAARDAYPELYTISLAALEWRTRPTAEGTVRSGRSATAARPSRRGFSRSAPRGAAAFLWVDTLMFVRRVSPAMAATVAVLALAGGAAFALVVRRDSALALGMLFGTLPGLAIALASTTGIRLAPALRMPVFWLGDVPLAARLAAWTGGAFSRDAAVVALAVAGYVSVAHEWRVPLLVLVAATVLLALTRAIGLVAFALLPHQLDQRGPAVLIRAALSFALVAPPAAVGLIAALAFGALFAAIAAGAFVAAAETALLVICAAWLLAGRVDRLSAQ